jgi:hypothetical protein
MTIPLIAFAVLALVSALAWGLLCVLADLREGGVHEPPIFRDPGPIFHDQVADYSEVKSQFAWQSRSHSRAPD